MERANDRSSKRIGHPSELRVRERHAAQRAISIAGVVQLSIVKKRVEYGG